MPSPSGGSIGAASAAADGTSSGSGAGVRGHLSNRGSSTVNVDAMARSSKRKAQQKQLPPMAKKSPSKRSSSSTSPSSTSSASPAACTATNAASNSNNDDPNQNVRVVARLRPLSKKEIDENSKEATIASGKHIIVEGQRNFEYDAVFGPQTTQEEVYKATAGNTVERNIFRGFNVTILAYGQTGAGKSHTMGTAASTSDEDDNDNGSGDDECKRNANSLKPPSKGDGIIGRAVYDLFKTRASMPNGKERVTVEMSYLEIYNEEAQDLMYSGTKPPELHIRDSKSEGVIVRNLSRQAVSSPTDVANLMREAAARRVTASTQMNAVSSRSHAVCTLYVTIAPPTADCDEKNDADGNSSSTEELKAKLTLVDLAGSERIKRTGAEGARMREGININKGLFVLGQVVSALSELGQQPNGSSPSSNNAHIPYRDSKLTRLLQDSLGGNSKTVMVACVSPAESNVEESTNTLRYAERARNIKNNATRNVIDRAMSPAEAAALRRENQMLKLQLLQAQMANASTPGGAMISGTSGMPAAAGVGGAVVAQGRDKFTETSLLNGINVEKLEIVTRLRANITSMETKVSQLEQRSVSSAEDALIASFKADKWRQRYENLTATLAAKGIDLPEEVKNACTAPSSNGDESETLVMQLRRELADLKEQLRDSQTDAEVARAMAAAVIAGEGDLTAVEHLALAGDEALVSGENGNKCDITAANDDNENDDGSSEHTNKLSAELVAVDDEIGRKEELMGQMAKERECMDALKGHFQSALRRLQEEVDVLSSERESLLKKVGSSGSGSVTGKKRGPGGVVAPARSDHDESPEQKRMRARIAELEDRIKTLKKKTAEHTKSIRMREAAERKCSQLAAEIAADKRRRAGLQKELKELSTQRRQEKKAAKQQAARMLRDSQKMKSELQKVKDQAARQNAVLRRKAAEAVSKQKQAEEKQKKRNSAAAVRSARITTNSIGLQRREELTNWLEKEIGAATAVVDIRKQIEEQTDLIQEATMRKNEMAKSKRHESAAALQSLEIEIGTRKSVIDQLEKNLEEVYKSVLGNDAKAPTSAATAATSSSSSSTSCFIDTSTWQGLTRQEMRLIHTNTFSRLIDLSRETATLRAKATDSHKLAVSKATSEERKRSDAAIMRLKMDHSSAMMTLLESTKESVQHQLRQDLTAIGIGEDGLDESTKASIDAMLASYFSGCERVGQSVKNDLNDVREKHDSMKAFVDQVAKGIIAKNEASALLDKKEEKKKKKATKKSLPSPEEDSDFDLFDDDDDDAGAYEDSDDSDWSPDTPAPKRKKKKTETSKSRDSFSDDDEEHQLAGENIIISRPDTNHEKKEDVSSIVLETAAMSSSPLEAMEMESLTVAELRSRLKEKGKAVSGRKAELIKRLRATGVGGGTPASSLVASTSTRDTVAKENCSPSSTNQTGRSLSLKQGTLQNTSTSSSASSSSSKDQSSVMGRPPRKRPATSSRSTAPSASSSARNGSNSNLAKSARQPPTGAAADVLTASARKRRRRSMTRAVEQMEVEMANIREERK